MTDDYGDEPATVNYGDGERNIVPSSQSLTPSDATLEKLMDVLQTAQRNYDDLTSMRFGLNPVADSVLDAAHQGIRRARTALRKYLSERTLTEKEHCLLCGRKEVEGMIFVRDVRSGAFVCMICRDEQVSGRNYTPPSESMEKLEKDCEQMALWIVGEGAFVMSFSEILPIASHYADPRHASMKEPE